MNQEQRTKDLSIVIIEESDVIKQALREAFSEMKGCEVVGMATEPNEGLRLVILKHPDVILMDVSAHTGVELLRRIRNVDRGVVVIVFTTDNSTETRIACRESGATFYLIKWQLRELLCLLQLAHKLI